VGRGKGKAEEEIRFRLCQDGETFSILARAVKLDTRQFQLGYEVAKRHTLYSSLLARRGYKRHFTEHETKKTVSSDIPNVIARTKN
jgi:hypothetical protein